MKLGPPVEPARPALAADLGSAQDSALIFDWNAAGTAKRAAPRILLLDETLRDGLQSPSVTNPTLEEKLAGVELMNALGIEYV
ncbi:MAG TPA: hypothetical protein VGL19_08320, partial [Polyangiaceae bacterium]